MGEPMFRYNETLGWFPIPGSSGRYTASREITYSHNELGLREDPISYHSKYRVLVLGDSFTWGFDVEQDERFTELLSKQFPAIDWVNAGVNGYGTDQQFVLLQQLFPVLKPDAVLLLFFGENDRIDNSTNQRHGGFYKPYFVQQTEHELQLKGIPVPKGARYFYAEHPLLSKSLLVRLGVNAWFKQQTIEQVYVEDPTEKILGQISEFLQHKQTPFLLATQSADSALFKFAISQSLTVLDVSNSFRYETFGGHWTPEGHQFVADSLAAFFLQENWLPAQKRTP